MKAIELSQTMEEKMKTNETTKVNCWTCKGSEYYEVGETDSGGEDIFITCPDCNGSGLREYPDEVGTFEPTGITLKGLYVITGRYEEWKEMQDGQ